MATMHTAPASFSLPWDAEGFDMRVTCNDNVIVLAHRAVLMCRCSCAPLRFHAIAQFAAGGTACAALALRGRF